MTKPERLNLKVLIPGKTTKFVRDLFTFNQKITVKKLILDDTKDLGELHNFLS